MYKNEQTNRELLRDKFQHELDESSKCRLIEAFTAACLQFLQAGEAVFLQNFGLLVPAVEKRSVSVVAEDKCIARDIKIRTVNFYKCSELTSFARERFPKIIEEKELAEACLSKLELLLQAEWQIEKLRRYIAGLILAIRHDVISQGVSKLVPDLGEFYALHNRQGNNLEDWYAGSNIIFTSNCNRELSCIDCRVYDRPVLQSAWELMTSLYGNPIQVQSVNICKDLRSLGFDLDRSFFDEHIEQQNIQVGVFANKNANQQQLIFCTDGLRELGIRENNLGQELVFQAAYDADFRDSARDSTYVMDDLLLPNWPKSVLLMGWIMMQNSPVKAIESGVTLSFRRKLCPEIEGSRLTGIVATPFSLCRSELLCDSGRFSFINLLGITDDEFKLAEYYSPDVLLTLLKARRMDQITKVCRPNLLAKTSLLELSQTSPQTAQAENFQSGQHQISINA